MNRTKKALSLALKELMQEVPFEKITINDLTKKTGVSRNTFYYHFSDINQLLEWTFDHEIVCGLESYETIDNWQEGLLSVLNYTEKNRKFCLNTFHSINRDRLEAFLYRITYEMLLSIMEKTYDAQLQNGQLKNQIADFYSRAIVAQVIQWLTTRLEEPKDCFIARLEAVTKGTIKGIVLNHCSKP